jgi:hypothetical protein
MTEDNIKENNQNDINKKYEGEIINKNLERIRILLKQEEKEKEKKKNLFILQNNQDRKNISLKNRSLV